MWLDPVPASLPVHHRAFLRRVLLAAFTLALLVLIAHPRHARAADEMPPCPLAPQSRLRPEMAAVVAPGIAHALIATAAGLFAAIPAVYFYNHFTNRVKHFSGEMDDFALEFLNIAERNFT